MLWMINNGYISWSNLWKNCALAFFEHLLWASGVLPAALQALYLCPFHRAKINIQSKGRPVGKWHNHRYVEAKQTTSSHPLCVTLSLPPRDTFSKTMATGRQGEKTVIHFLSHRCSSPSHPILCDTSVCRWKPHLERISVRERERVKEACWRRVKAMLGSSFCFAQGVVKCHFTHIRSPDGSEVALRGDKTKYTQKDTHTFTQIIFKVNSLTRSHPEWGPTWNLHTHVCQYKPRNHGLATV